MDCILFWTKIDRTGLVAFDFRSLLVFSHCGALWKADAISDSQWIQISAVCYGVHGQHYEKREIIVVSNVRV